MRQVHVHPWDLSCAEAVAVQRQLRDRVELVDRLPVPLRTVAGVDISYERRLDRLYAVLLLFSFPELTPLSCWAKTAPATWPYVPGLLTFREGPLVCRLLEECEPYPDLLVGDGQGIAHPRGLGLAAHIGVLFDLPAIGCAKSRLVGESGPLAPEKGARVPLVMPTGTVSGMVLRTRDGVKPVYVSPGHRVSVETAANLVLRLTTRYRLPEVTRRAHLAVNGFRRVWRPETW